MLQLQDETVMSMAGGVLFLVAAVFALRVVRLGAGRHAQLWALSFISAVLACLAFSPFRPDSTSRGMDAAAQTLVVLSFGLMWSGIRLRNGRPALLAVAALPAGVTLGAVLLAGPVEAGWAGAEVYIGAVAATSALIAVEAARTDPRTTGAVDARILAASAAALALYSLARLGAVVAVGSAGDLIPLAFERRHEAIAHTSFLLVAAICLSALVSAETPGRRTSRTRGAAAAAEGVLEPDAFATALGSWLDRADGGWDCAVLVVVEIDDLDDVAAAFGRQSAARMVTTVARIVARHAPTASVVGHLDDDRLAVLCEPPSRERPVAIAERLLGVLVDTPLDDLDGLRAIATIGVATTDDAGYEPGPLIAAATAAAAGARTHGGGRVGTMADAEQAAAGSRVGVLPGVQEVRR